MSRSGSAPGRRLAVVLVGLASAAIAGAAARAVAPATVTSAFESGLSGAGIALFAPDPAAEAGALLPPDHGLFEWMKRHRDLFGGTPRPTAELPLIEVEPNGTAPQRPLDPDLADVGALEVTYPAGDAVAGGGALLPLGGSADTRVGGASEPSDHHPARGRRGLAEV